MPTSILWARLARMHDVIAVNAPIVMKEYHGDGMTGKSRELRIESIRSSTLFYEECLSDFGVYYNSINYGIRVAANYLRYSIHNRHISMRRLSSLTASQITLISLSVPLGFVLFLSDLFYSSKK